MSALISRSEARAAGLTVYFTGKPCKHGHIARRWVSNSRCDECMRVYLAAYYVGNKAKYNARSSAYYVSNRDKVLAYGKDWYVQNRDRLKPIRQEYAQANKEKAIEAARRFRESHPDRVKEISRRWTSANKDKINAKTNRRRARKASAEGFYTAEDAKLIFERQKGKCACCGKKRKLTVDHIIALSRGGSNWPSNLQGLCGSCNSSKRDHDPIVFMQSLGRLL